jgi:mannose-6-phosphate isomerase-like protein (cupin superfamily)
VEANVRRAIERLEIPWPVAIDTDLEVWDIYGNQGWPARYLWDRELILHSLHYGEGAYDETERAIQELLGVSGPLVAPLRPEDAPDALIATPTADVSGPFSGRYEAGGVWVVVDGSGDLRIDDDVVEVDEPGCFPVALHSRHTASSIRLEPGPGVTVHATCFTPGVV